MKRMTRRAQGFSLLELVVVLAIMLIVFSMSIIGVQAALRSYRASGDATALTEVLSLTRMRAAESNTHTRLNCSLTTNFCPGRPTPTRMIRQPTPSRAGARSVSMGSAHPRTAPRTPCRRLRRAWIMQGLTSATLPALSSIREASPLMPRHWRPRRMTRCTWPMERSPWPSPCRRRGPFLCGKTLKGPGKLTEEAQRP